MTPEEIALKEFIATERERLRRRRPEYFEAIAGELAGRGLLGGGMHMRALGGILEAEEEYLSQLARKLAELRIAKAEEERRKRELRRMRRGQMLQQLIGIALPYVLPKIGRVLRRLPPLTAYQGVPPETPVSEIGNQVQSMLRPRGRTYALLPEDWREQLGRW